MFEIFAGERRAHPQWCRRDTLLLSLGLHVLVLVGVAHVPLRSWTEAPPAPRDATITFLDLLQVQETPVSPAGEPGASSSPDPPLPEGPTALRPPVVGRAIGELTAPQEIPGGLPEVRPDEGVAGSFVPAGAGAPVRLATGGESVRRALANEPVDISLVAELPVLRNRGEMRWVWQRLYPFSLMVRRIEGEAVVRFVIGTDGRVDPSTILLVRTSHPKFGEATLQGVRKLRFRPARLGGRSVRVRAELPIYWKMQDVA
ncbi:MAG TPA: TonB family protein [Longimicrobiaceae bacterium]|nr:TonB family protein [Longimicrobiaceae bacterium]